MAVRILVGDCREKLKELPEKSVQCCVSSPPYFGLRSYGIGTENGEIGLEPTPDEFIAAMVAVFREVRRVLADDGTVFLNLGDSYSRNPAKGGSGTPNGRNVAEMNYAGGMRLPAQGRLRLRTDLAADVVRSVLSEIGVAVGASRKEPVAVGGLDDDLNGIGGTFGIDDVLDHLSHDVAQSLLLRETAVPASLRKYFTDTGAKEKDLLMIPARVALALQADGWWLRSHIIWHKPNPMPESVTDRPTSSHESIFLLSKASRYFYDAEAVKEAATYAAEVRVATPKNMALSATGEHGKPSREYGHQIEDGKRNLRNVWSVPSQPFSGAHFATFPPALIEPCIKAGSRKGDTVLDPFGGAGTTGLVADRLGRNAVLTELNPEYAAMAHARIRDEQPMFADVHLEAAE